jgi:ATP-dependent RNA helicase DeaD
MEQFRDLGLSETMLKTLAKKGFTEPTPIQKSIIPFLLNETRDVVAQAETGTGKTAAFGIPIIERLGAPCGQVKALVLVPTRELALQVAEEIRSLKGKKKIEVVSVYGGQAFGPQRNALRKGADIVVGTTGRILDHLRRGTLCLDSISFLVLDEADEMLDMGFIDDIRAIIAQAPAERRTMLFSATMPREVVAIARKHMKDYEAIATTRRSKAVPLTDQIYLEVREEDKFEALCRILDMEPDFYGLVFCRTRVETAETAEKLISQGYDAEGIHGEIEQLQREQIMRRFREKHITVLVATDVAARGIDVSNLSHVINYALPQNADAYVHRIGRTGRAGARGIAITFVGPREQRALEAIRLTSGRSMRRGSIPAVADVIAAKRSRIREEVTQVMQEEDLRPYESLAAELLQSGDAETVLAACLRYTFADELDTSAYKEIRKAAPRPEAAGHERLFFARGRRHGLTPQNLLKFIREQTGVKGKLVWDIEIRDDFTFFNVPQAEAALIRKKFGKKGGRSLVGIARPEQKKRAFG